MLLSVASVILGLAFFGPNMNKTSRTLNYSEFRQAWDQGRIVTDDTKRPLKVVTSDTAYDAVIIGWEKPRLVKPKTPETKRNDFQVRVNLDLQGEQIRDMLGDEVRMQQVDPATGTPIEGDMQTLTLAEFRRSFSLGEINSQDPVNPLRILTNAASRDAVIVGTREVVTNMVEPKDETTGKPIDATPFRVEVSTVIQGEELRELVKGKAVYERRTDYLKNALFTFLPFLLIIGLLFFLFRQQMKSAGRRDVIRQEQGALAHHGSQQGDFQGRRRHPGGQGRVV